MALRATCPACETVHKVDEKYDGRVIVCRQCQQRFRVEADADREATRPASRTAPRDRASSAASSRGRKGGGRASKRSGPHWAYIAAGSFAAALIVCLALWNLFLKPDYPKVPHPEVPRASDLELAQDFRSFQTPAGGGRSKPAVANQAPPQGVPTEPSRNRPIVATLPSTAAVPRETHRPANAKTAAPKSPALPQGDLAALPLEELIAKVGDGVVLITVIDRTGKPVGLGTGFVIDDAGLVATCYHVVRNAARVQVQFRDGFKTMVKGSRQLNSQSDLAILELEKNPPHVVRLDLALNDELRLGQEVIAMGHPSGLTFTPTRGIISGLHKTSDLPPDARQFLSLRKASKDEEWVQTDAVISPGNSGGPLMNRRGEVVGVNSWVSTQTRFAFAVHVKHLEELRQNLFASAKPLSKGAQTSQVASISEEPPSELEEKVGALFEEYQRAAEDFVAQLNTLPAGEYSRSTIDAIFRKNPANKYAGRFLALGKENRKTKTALQSYFMACWLLRGADPKQTTGVLQQAADLMLADHLADHEVYRVVMLMPALPQAGAKGFLRSLIQKTSVRETRAYSCLALAKTLQHEADEKPVSAASPATDQEIVALLKRVTDEFSDVKLEGQPLKEMIKPLLFAKERLAVGKKAIDIEGPDAEGNEFKLSDYRGNVVLLTFWGDWSRVCARMYPYERILVSKYKGRKFAMLGVNTDPPERLDAVQKEKKVNWRSWSDGSRTGRITKQWGVETFPVMYLIDHKGTIRMRGTFDPDTIDQSIDILVAEAEGRSKGSRSAKAAVRRILQQR